MYRYSVLILMVALLGTEIKMHPANLGIKPAMKPAPAPSAASTTKAGK